MHRIVHFFSFKGRIDRVHGLCHMILASFLFYFGLVLVACAIMGTDSPHTTDQALAEVAAVAVLGGICAMAGVVRMFVILGRRFRDAGKNVWYAGIYGLALFTLPQLFSNGKGSIFFCMCVFPFLLKGRYTENGGEPPHAGSCDHKDQ